MAGRPGVGALAAGEQIERLTQGGPDVAEGLLGGFEVPHGLGDVAREPSLLLSEQVDGNSASGVSVEKLSVEKLLALGGELGQPAALAGRLLLRLLAHPGKGLVELRAHEFSLFVREANLRVGMLDRPLDELDRHVGLVAARCPACVRCRKK